MHSVRWPAVCGAMVATFLAVGATSAGHAQAPDARGDGRADRALLDQYCLGCHNGRTKAGGLALDDDRMDLGQVGAGAETWEKVVRKLRAGMMPPAGRPRPARSTSEAFVARLEADLDRAAAADPNPGRTEPLHRLNRAEYQNAVRDLLDLDLDVSALLPADDASYGFDNIAGVLKLSPTLMERYLSAAQKISRIAVGTPPPFPSIDYFRIADDLAQDDRLPGLSFGTRGGTLIRYPFPMDADYEIRVQIARDLNESVPLYTEPQHLEVSIDGERVQLFTLPGVGAPTASPSAPGSADGEAPAPQTPNAQAPRPRPQISQVAQGLRASREERERRNRADQDWHVRIPVQAGTREVQIAFIRKTAALAETIRLPFERPYPAGVNIAETRMGVYLWNVEISGPYDPTGPGNAPSRQRIFVCPAADGAAGSVGAAEETSCAETILRRLARRAYRRPVTDADLEPLIAFYQEGRAEGSFDAGIERALRRLLVSPEFLFRVEREPSDAAPFYRVSDLELASRLSFFLWSSLPDEELLDLAEQERLSDPAVLSAQVRRLVADDRFEAFVENFAGQWLFLRNLEAAVPVQSFFPDFDDTLRQAFRRETELFFESVAREDRSALDLLRADYTFLNERLAKHYGVPHVKGSHFRRVTLGRDSVRGGLLGQGSILTVTAQPDRTSPVLRGKWILENLFGAPPPAPPPNVPDLEPTSDTGDVLSMRERMVQHRENPVCASCHATMDPLGLALENFDAIGKWRTLAESGAPIDASGALPDGTPFEGPGGLKQALLSSDLFVTTLTEKLLTYALGRGLEYSDMPAVRAIVREAGADNYRLSSLIAGVVQSTPFQYRLRAQDSGLRAMREP